MRIKSISLLALSLLFLTPQLLLGQQNAWPVSDPGSEGLNAKPLADLETAIEEGVYAYIDRLLIVRNGKIVVDSEFVHDYDSISVGHASTLGCGADTCETAAEESSAYNYLHPSTHPYYQGRDVHSLQSITKSVASTLIGVALSRGEIASLETPILPFFAANYDISGVDPRLHRATLEDLLTMRTGIEWHETDRPMDSTNTTLQLEWSSDWIQFTLDQPSNAEPGKMWSYNSGGSHLMSGLIKMATGKFIDEYAEEHLFAPLGIEDYHWKKTPKGFPDTEGGLYLEATDLAKIGQLYLQGGMWNGQRILDQDFVTSAVGIQVLDVYPNGWDYGYQWWRLDSGSTEIWAGLGFGGQYLVILPQHQIVGVVNSWNLFGAQQAGILRPFLTALIESTRQ